MNDTIYVRPIREIDPLDTALYGGKATGLARMAAAGIPVPPAFVISTHGYRAFREQGGLPDLLRSQAAAAVVSLEQATGKRFGRLPGPSELPLLVSVRSGAQISMPGMMDTVLNLGITTAGAQRLAESTGNRAFALDTWLRFWRMFSDIVLGLDGDDIAQKVASDAQKVRGSGSAADWGALEQGVLAAIRGEGVEEIETDPRWQLQRAIAAVFESWDSRRARAYRAHHKIDDNLGTAVTIQAMVFGNLDARSGSGVAFTRNPNTGARQLYGEFLLGRQGEDLVSGSTTPTSITEPGAMSAQHQHELYTHGQALEGMYRDAVDIEFTIEGAQLYFLQVRAAKRTAQAAVVIATDLVDEGRISSQEAIGRVAADQLKKLLRPTFEPEALAAAATLAEGISASPGHAWGVAVLDADRACERAGAGERVVLLRPTTSPQDIRGMLACDAIVTSRGGALSHAAVVSRARDVPCVVGCEHIDMEPDARRFTIAGRVFEEGMPLSVDGGTGRVYAGHLPVEAGAEAGGHIDRLLQWADQASGARFWTTDVGGMAQAAGAEASVHGFGAAAVTTLIIGNDGIAQFIKAINDLSLNPDDAAVQQRIADQTRNACTPVLERMAGRPVVLRLPNLGSTRAQRLIDTWASLAPRLLLPLGVTGFHASVLRGIAQAQESCGHTQLTVLAPALGHEQELAAFRLAARAVGISDVGVMLQSSSGLFAAKAMAASGAALWLDIWEVIRSFHGYPSSLSFGQEVFEECVAGGYLPFNPCSRLGPELRSALEQVTRGLDAAKVVVECGDGLAQSLIEELYELGLRQFSFSAAGLTSARLGLGQRAHRKETS
ncbi:MAG: hypothetical protein BGO13_10315 [Burkholderiales bacterium 66-5]|nr:MAG: hypothetical protein BGO13_10315 [Burkholderiales bacterium 66-5]